MISFIFCHFCHYRTNINYPGQMSMDLFRGAVRSPGFCRSCVATGKGRFMAPMHAKQFETLRDCQDREEVPKGLGLRQPSGALATTMEKAPTKPSLHLNTLPGKKRESCSLILVSLLANSATLLSVDSIYPDHERSAWITAQRPARSGGNPYQPYGFFLECEPAASGRILRSAGILLTNKECPWHCLMCDLWKHTLPHSVPPGAIPRQIDYALAELGVQPDQLKLYNSGSFFDPAAIPPEDYAPIAERVSFAQHIIVESHPRLIGEKALRFRDLIEGSLEVAMGLETVHPEVLPRLNKRFTLEHFAQASEFLRKEGIAVRAFVLVQPPFLEKSEAIEWAVKSAQFAFSCGATVVSLIPTRGGNGALERLRESGDFKPPSLSTLEQSLTLSLQLRAGRVFADTWDLEKFSSCPACFERREQRLNAINIAQIVIPEVRCISCEMESELAER